MDKTVIILSMLCIAGASTPIDAVSIGHNHGGDVHHVVQVTPESARILELVLKKGAVYTGSVLCGALGLRIIYAMVKNKQNRTPLVAAAVAGSFLAACGLFYSAAYLL